MEADVSDADKPTVLRGEIIPPEARHKSVQMPDGTPLGLGFLGAMKFDAVRRVFDSYERALRAAESARDAEAAHHNAVTRREVAKEQLLNLDTIREAERNRILNESKRMVTEAERAKEEAELEKLRRKLAKIELQVQIAEKNGQLERVKAKYEARDRQQSPKDEFTDLLEELKRMPDIAQALIATKANIVKQFGGEENLGEEGQQLIDSLNSIISATIQKRASDKLL